MGVGRVGMAAMREGGAGAGSRFDAFAAATFMDRLLIGPGYYELRLLQRLAMGMAPRGSRWLPHRRWAAEAAVDDGWRERRRPMIEAAAAWAARQAAIGVEVFVGPNPRARRRGRQADIELATACFVDLDDVAPDRRSAALEALATASAPPSLVVASSARGLHAYWLLAEPAADLATWRAVP